MKKLLIPLLLLFIFTLNSCTSDEEKAKLEKQIKDLSIQNDKVIANSKHVDSLRQHLIPNLTRIKFTDISWNVLKNRWCIMVENFDKKNNGVWTDIENEAKSKGVTTGYVAIFFFNDKSILKFKNRDVPTDSDDGFGKYDNSCVAGYWHYPNGSEQLKEYPMK